MSVPATPISRIARFAAIAASKIMAIAMSSLGTGVSRLRLTIAAF
jgi:hypothetical protein